MAFTQFGIKAVMREKKVLKISVLSVLAKDSPIQNNQRKQETKELWGARGNNRTVDQARNE